MAWPAPYDGSRVEPIGAAAGALVRSGHRHITIDGRRYQAHRLAWFYMHGRWPADQIDHANNLPDDNRLVNLREATAAQNQANQGRKSNARFLKGVSFDQKSGRFRARITQMYRTETIGFFDTEEQAHAAYCRRAAELFGEFARAA